jgi:membrane-associated protease RseP (regulator of RpoE activity)
MTRIVAVILCWILNYAVWVTLWEQDVVDSGLAALAITAVLSFFAILVHELGHAAAAHRLRIPVVAIAVIPFELRLRPLRLTMNPAAIDRDIGGYVELEDDEFRSMRKDAIVAAAGPVANLIFALIATVLAVGLYSYFWTDLKPVVVVDSASGITGPVSLVLPSDAEIARSFAEDRRRAIAFAIAGLANAFAVLSAGMALFNLLPFAGSDGHVIGRWLRFRWPGWINRRG